MGPSSREIIRDINLLGEEEDEGVCVSSGALEFCL
jgi:hypothetical protein